MATTIKIAVLFDMYWLMKQTTKLGVDLDPYKIESAIQSMIAFLPDSSVLNPVLPTGASLQVQYKKAFYLNLNGTFNIDDVIERKTPTGKIAKSFRKIGVLDEVVKYSGDTYEELGRYYERLQSEILKLEAQDFDYVVVFGPSQLQEKIMGRISKKIVGCGTVRSDGLYKGLLYYELHPTTLKMFKDYERPSHRERRMEVIHQQPSSLELFASGY